MSHDGGSSCKSYIKHPTEKERLDNLAFTSFPEDYLPYTSSYHRKAPYLVWDDGFRPHRKRRLKRWRESKACRCCTAAALTVAISLIIIGILSIVAVSIYLGVITSLFRSPILSLSGKMSVVEGDEFTDSLLNTTSYEFLAKAETYQAMLENIYLSSSLEPAFVAAKVYAFRKGNLTVFFRIYLDRRKLLQSDEETLLIAKNVILEHAVKRRPEFSALSLNMQSVEFRENKDEEQSPEMDFDFREEPEKTRHKFDEEAKHSQFLNYPAGNVDHQSDDVHQPTSAPASGNAETPTNVEKEEEPGPTQYSYVITGSVSVTVPSHTPKEHEEIVSSERPVSREENNVSITYGHWQPLVPVLKPAVDVISTKRPPLKDHRRITGSGSVHLVEEQFMPIVSQKPPKRNSQLPVASEVPKPPQPNVASSIMSSVSLVILPSSKNRTVTVANDKNKNVIETALKLPTQQPPPPPPGDSKLPDRDADTGDTSASTRNIHASLRFIEDFERNVNWRTDQSANKTVSDRVFNESQKRRTTPEASNTTEESSKSNPGGSRIEIKASAETSADADSLEWQGGSEKLTNVFSASTGFLLPTGSPPVGESLTLFSSAKGNESVSSNSVSVSSSTQQPMGSLTTNRSQHSYVTLQDFSTNQTTPIPDVKIVAANDTPVLTATVEETILKEEDIDSESNIDDDDTLQGTTDILLGNFNFYDPENDTDSSGFLDTYSQLPGINTGNPNTSTSVLQDDLRTTTETSSLTFSNETVYALVEFPVTDSNPVYTTESDDSELSSAENIPQKDDSSGSANLDDGESNSTVRGSEEQYSGPNSDATAEVETHATVAVSFNRHHGFDTNSSAEESARSENSDLSSGGLPKIVPPFANTQYIPNDIHSDTDIHKKNEKLDDEELLYPAVTYDTDVHLNSTEVQPTGKPHTETIKDFQPPDDENVVVHHITTEVSLENDSIIVGLGKYPTYFLDKCSDEEITCGSGECIPAGYQCNMRRDCRDNSDEDHCSCTDNLKVIGQTQKICDGIQDCWDLSDEENCPWCSPGQFICPQSKLCIEMNQVCDGSNDCPFGTDEKYCVKLAEDEVGASSSEYQPEGYLIIRKQGQWGKLCLENLHSLAQPENLRLRLGELGHAVCSALSYKEISEAAETKDVVGTNQSYFEISTQTTKKESRQYTDIFQPTECQSKSVVRVTCKSLECGMRPMAFSLRRRIVGGHSASSGSWPWQVALYKEGDFQCGAVLVSDVWLISAGHCFYSSRSSHWTARLGVLRRGTELPSPSEQVRRISHIFIHPDYVDKGFINDIALLRMESPVPFSDFLRPLCLPNETEEVSMWHGHHCSVIGWGKLYEIGHTFPDSLQEVRLPVISTEECRKKILFLTMYHLTDNMFCAGYERGGRDACLGDSGGPLMCQRQDGRWVLLGVTSNGDGCGRPGRPGVYTKVTKYLTWINEVMDGELPPEQTTSCAGHRCSLGHCVVETKVCDGRWDCSDGSDEINCFI